MICVERCDGRLAMGMNGRGTWTVFLFCTCIILSKYKNYFVIIYSKCNNQGHKKETTRTRTIKGEDTSSLTLKLNVSFKHY